MSLVDYASSSDEDNDVLEAEEQQHEDYQQQKQDDDVLEAEEQEHKHHQQEEHKPSPPPVINQRSESSTPAAVVAPLPPIEKLPDASVLLNSSCFSSFTVGNDHASRVAAAMATRKKRDSNGLELTSATLLPRSKVAKGGTLPHTKSVFDTAGGLLVPPQLSGRSNVVTEDISKLFVKREAERSSQ